MRERTWEKAMKSMCYVKSEGKGGKNARKFE